MAAQEQIFAALKGCSAQAPLAFTELIKKTSIPAIPLIEVLQDLFDARAINRCTVTREGRTQVMVWPTGVVSKIDYFRNYPPIAELQEVPAVENEKSKARIMIEMIAEKGKATGKELIEASGASAVKPFIKGYCDRGLIVITGDHNDKTYSLARGVTPEKLLSDGRSKAAKQEGILPDRQELIPADHVPDVGNMIEQPAPAQACAETRTETSARPRFRVAVTSDKTILLFGLSQEPIELDREQAQVLAEFISERDILCV